jgi:hypothetical protein
VPEGITADPVSLVFSTKEFVVEEATDSQADPFQNSREVVVLL